MTGKLVHPAAVVEDGAVLGEGTRVWHHAHVQSGARIGDRCTLGKDVFVGKAARVGHRVKIQNGVSVYDGVELEDDVFVGPHAVFTNVNEPRAFVDRKHEIRPTLVEKGATIGAGAVIVCGHRIGAYAFVGAGAVVTADVAAHALVVGNPARRVGWVSRLGRRLPNARVATCPESGDRYLCDAASCRPLADGEEPPPAPPAFVDLAALHAPLLPELRAAFDQVVRGGRFILGEEVAALERELAARIGVRHAIGVSSGTDAILASLMALGVGPGDEVVTTPFSFFATAGCVARLGATPVFADIEDESMNLDPKAVRAAISPRTRAILPVHLFGRPASLELLDLAASRGIPVVEDAAQALGASTSRGPVGSLGALGCFSFFPTKSLGALGDAGMVTTNDDQIAERLRLLRVQGARPKYHHVLVGGNFRLDELQAAFLRVKLPHLDRWTAERRALAGSYEAWFAELDGGIRTPGLIDGHVYHQYVVRTPDREALRARLAAAGVATEVYYPEPLHLMPCFEQLARSRGWGEGSFPVAERACREVVAVGGGLVGMTGDSRERAS